jgi:hypothetical protein
MFSLTHFIGITVKNINDYDPLLKKQQKSLDKGKFRAV